MKKTLYSTEFKGKKITVMGLGVLGRGIQVTKFLAECGATLTVTDLKDEKELATSLKLLKKYNIRYVLGKHDIKDFENVDLVVKAAGVPMDSMYIEHARKSKVRVVMDASLFAKIVQATEPRVTIIGITGTRGKSMTTALIYHILKENEAYLKSKIYLGGNMRMKATLPLLKDVQPGDTVVLELDSWQCQGFGDEHISPHIAVFTSFMPDHMNYYKDSMSKYLKDKCNIFKFQKKEDVLVTSKNTLSVLPKKIKSNILLSETKEVSKISMHIFGDHNIQNASYAYTVAKHCGLSKVRIIKALKSFVGLEGRLQYLGTKKGVHIINDNNSTTADAAIAGISATRSTYKKSNIILIAGGSDKNLELSKLVKILGTDCAHLVLLSGNGSERLKQYLDISYTETHNLKSAVTHAFAVAKMGDAILFSPGFASFGMFKNEYDRNDQFLDIIKKWK